MTKTNEGIIPRVYTLCLRAESFSRAAYAAAQALAEAKAEAQKLATATLLPAAREKAEASANMKLKYTTDAHETLEALCRGYLQRAYREARRAMAGDIPALRYAGRIVMPRLLDICVERGCSVRKAGNSDIVVSVWKAGDKSEEELFQVDPAATDAGDEAEALSMVVRSVSFCFEDAAFCPDDTKAEAEEERITSEIARAVEGKCPYHYDTALRIAADISQLAGKYPYEVTAEIVKMPTASAGQSPSEVVMTCRGADAIIRKKLTSAQLGIILEALALGEIPRDKIDEITVTTPPVCIGLTRADVSTITSDMYGCNEPEECERLYADISKFNSKDMRAGYDYIDKSGRVVHRDEQLVSYVIETYKDTGVMKGMTLVLSPVFYLEAKKHFHVNLQHFRKAKLSANGKEFGVLFFAVNRHRDKIAAATRHGNPCAISVQFADIIPADTPANRAAERKARAIAAAREVAKQTGATSWKVVKQGRTRVGISFNFAPVPSEENVKKQSNEKSLLAPPKAE